jgi:adenylosuccinate synthase
MGTFVADLDVLAKVEVQYERFEGWKTSISSVRTYEALPANCKTYISFIEKFLNVPVEWIGTGAARGDMIKRAI